MVEEVAWNAGAGVSASLDGSRGVGHAGSLGVPSDGMLPKLLTYLTQLSRPIT
jgi:hypothetical protein